MEKTRPIEPKEIKQKLTAAGLKATTQRLVIYEAVLNTYAHPTADVIFEMISNQHPSIALGTVYKTLDVLVDAGLVRKVKTGDDVLRFDARIDDHSHLYCTKTNRILDYEDPELKDLLSAYFAKKQITNFKVTDFQVQINGELQDQ